MYNRIWTAYRSDLVHEREDSMNDITVLKITIGLMISAGVFICLVLFVK